MLTIDQVQQVYCSIYANEPRLPYGGLAVSRESIDVAAYLLISDLEDSRENIAVVREFLNDVPCLVTDQHDNNEADMTTTKTTPTQVRAEIKRRGLKGLELVKMEGNWYVLGDATDDWPDHCLYTSSFRRRPAAYWVDQIVGMFEHKI